MAWCSIAVVIIIVKSWPEALVAGTVILFGRETNQGSIHTYTILIILCLLEMFFSALTERVKMPHLHHTPNKLTCVVLSLAVRHKTLALTGNACPGTLPCVLQLIRPPGSSVVLSSVGLLGMNACPRP